MSVLQKAKVNDIDIPEGVTKYDLYKVGCGVAHDIALNFDMLL